VKGEKTIVELFEKYAGTEEATPRQELLEKTVAQVISILVTPEIHDGNFQQLIAARMRYPTAFEDIVTVICRKLKLPTGLQSLLKLYRRTRDLSLREELLEIREEAFRNNRWEILEVFTQENLVEEFAELAQERKLR